ISPGSWHKEKKRAFCVILLQRGGGGKLLTPLKAGRATAGSICLLDGARAPRHYYYDSSVPKPFLFLRSGKNILFGTRSLEIFSKSKNAHFQLSLAQERGY